MKFTKQQQLEHDRLVAAKAAALKAVETAQQAVWEADAAVEDHALRCHWEGLPAEIRAALHAPHPPPALGQRLVARGLASGGSRWGYHWSYKATRLKRRFCLPTEATGGEK